MTPLIAQLTAGESLSEAQAQSAFDAVLSGATDAADTEALLLALKAKGETIAEITGAARAMRAHMTEFDSGHHCMDVCGTGGDGLHTYNISTTVAFVVAGCGVRVAKHGNRAVSSQSGSSDVLSALGIGLSDNHDTLRRCLDDASLCFLAAPLFHPALRHVAPIRAKLKTRTIFNLLGPLCNPANVARQVMGVYDPSLTQPIAQVLQALGAESAAVVHGADGMDELSLSGASQVTMLQDGTLSPQTIHPEDAHLPTAPIAALTGADAAHNAAALRAVLEGAENAYRNAVVLNAALALVVAERADDLAIGAVLAAEAIDSGRALAVLEKLIEINEA